MRLFIATLALFAVACAPGVESPELTGYAQLPAHSFADGPVSGAFRSPGHGGPETFPGQPVQGVSALAHNPRGGFFALADNGFGSKANSADFLLRIYSLQPRFRTAKNGDAIVPNPIEFISLSDPQSLIGFPITNESDPQRLLTGADLDPESMVRMADGSFWIGDEFGPFLLHFDVAGRLLRAPIELPDLNRPGQVLYSPDHPSRAEINSPTPIPRSKGIESLAFDMSSNALLLMLEGSVLGDEPGSLRLLEYSLDTDAFTQRMWRYVMDDASYAVRDMAALGNNRYALIEGDSGHGPQAKIKRVFVIEPGDHNTPLSKQPLIDLMRVADPKNIAGFGPVFSLPYVTIEAILAIDDSSVLIVNDNNFPSAGARHPSEADPNEFVLIRYRRSRQ